MADRRYLTDPPSSRFLLVLSGVCYVLAGLSLVIPPMIAWSMAYQLEVQELLPLLIFGALLVGGLTGLLWAAVAEGIQLAIRIEENTRKTKSLLYYLLINPPKTK